MTREEAADWQRGVEIEMHAHFYLETDMDDDDEFQILLNYPDFEKVDAQ